MDAFFSFTLEKQNTVKVGNGARTCRLEFFRVFKIKFSKIKFLVLTYVRALILT